MHPSTRAWALGEQVASRSLLRLPDNGFFLYNSALFKRSAGVSASSGWPSGTGRWIPVVCGDARPPLAPSRR